MTIAEHLRESATRCNATAAATYCAEFAGPPVPMPSRGQEMLAEVADHCRTMAALWDSDPTLASDPGTDRLRPFERFDVLVLELPRLIRRAAGLDRRGPQPENPDLWHDVEAFAARLLVLLDQARDTARPDHDVPAVSEQISHIRLRACTDEFERGVRRVRTALDPALALPHPHPEAQRLAQVTDQLLADAHTLACEHTTPSEQT